MFPKKVTHGLGPIIKEYYTVSYNWRQPSFVYRT